MAWRLEIHHIDVTKSGDATLIIAREVAPLLVAGAPIIRSVLIDGGRAAYGVNVHNYIVAQLPGLAARLSAIIVTHYDDDHVGGIIRLLKRPTYRYSAVHIYDQGWPAGGLGQTYTRYVRAISGLGDGPVPMLAGFWNNRVRETRFVRSDGAAPVLGYAANVGAPGAAPVAAITQPASWLLTGAAPADPMWNGAPIAAPPGAPRMRFIAANRCVRTAGGAITAALVGIGLPRANEKCLAVEVTFNNFRYYVGGDIATLQENAIQTLLNNPDNAAGRVLAMKASHHGSNSATSRAFVDRLRPDAVFISCGTSNQFGHPAQETINVLDGFAANPTNANPCPPHAAVPPATPPNRAVDHYLNGYQYPAPPPPQTLAGDAGVTASVPGAGGVPGHIRLTVVGTQSVRDVRGGVYLGVLAAATAAATSAGLAGGAMAAGAAGNAATAAADASLSFGAAAAASAFLLSAGSTAAQQLAASNAANNAINTGLAAGPTATAVTAAALAAGNARAAGAGAAAGVVVGGFDGPSLQAAVTQALIAAGRAPAAAAVTGAGVVGQAVAAAGQFTVGYTDLVGAGNVIHA